MPYVLVKDRVEVGKEHGEDGCWNVERRREDNANVLDRHFVLVGFLNNVEKIFGQSAEQREIDSR